MKLRSLFRDRSKQKQSVGLELQSLGVAVSSVDNSASKLRLNYAIFEPFNPTEEKSSQLLSALKAIINQHDITKAKVNIALSSHYYQLLLIEAPNVPSDEVKSAVLWSIKDLTSLPQEHMHIEVFDLPNVKNKAAKKMIYVVIIDMRVLKKITAAFDALSIPIGSVNIQEMVLRDFLAQTTDQQHVNDAVALVRVIKNAGYIYIYKNQDLFLSRQFKLNYSGGLIEDLPVKDIANEIQRSLDYFERQLAQSLPQNVLLFGENILEDKLHGFEDEGLSVSIKMIDLLNLIDGKDKDIDCLNVIGAIGAALRREKPEMVS